MARAEGHERSSGSKEGDGPPLGTSVHPTYARLLVAELKRRGFSDEEIFHDTLLTWKQLQEEKRFLSFHRLRQLIHRGISLTGERWLGLDVGRTTQISSHGPVGYALMASPTVGEALELVPRFASLRIDLATFELARVDGRIRLEVRDSVGWGEVREYVACHIVGAFAVFFEGATGLPRVDARIDFAHSSPSSEERVAYRERLPGAELAFDAPVTAIEISEAFGATPCLTADPEAFGQALHLCERAREQRQQEGDLGQRVLEALLACSGSYPGLDEMASQLAMSSRSFVRKLGQQGTSYQRILDDVRQELALWYLQQTDLPVERVAERLGYADGSNFGRTCRRWFGRTPLQIRRGERIPGS